jgi:hypothetical protein
LSGNNDCGGARQRRLTSVVACGAIYFLEEEYAQQAMTSPSLAAAVAAAVVASMIAIPNKEWHNSKILHGGRMVTAAADSNDLPGASIAAIRGSGSGSGNDDGRQGRTLMGKGREPARLQTMIALLIHNC